MVVGLIQNLHWIKNGSLWEMPDVGDWQEKDDLDLRRYNAADDDTIAFSETGFSDLCIGAVFDNCAVPQDCFTLFLGKRYSEYVITHAILFLLFAKKVETYIFNFNQVIKVLVTIYRKNVLTTKST